MTRCSPATPTSSPWATRWKCRIRSPANGAWSRLAGPANRQGRIAADVISGRDSHFRGTQGTAIIGLFGAAAAWTGVSEKTLKRTGDTDFEKIYIYPNSHAGYYPGARPIAMKVLFRKSDGKLLGAQAVGEDGVDKRISVLAAMLQMGATVYDLEEAELCYAPQFGSAKDPVNFAGMVAAGVLRGDMPLSHWDTAKKAFILDVREPVELVVEHVPNAVQHPAGPVAQALKRAAEGPGDRRDLSLGSACLLRHAPAVANGYKAKNVSGGMLSLAHNQLLVFEPEVA